MVRSRVESSLRLRPPAVAIAVVVMLVGLARLEDIPVDVFPEILALVPFSPPLAS